MVHDQPLAPPPSRNSRHRRWVASLAVMAVVAAGCGGSDEATESSNPPSTETPSTTDAPADPPAGDVPASDPPVTDPPASDPPATDPPASDPPATDPPATDPPTSVAPVAPATGVVAPFAGELAWAIEPPIAPDSGAPFVVGISDETVAFSQFTGPGQPVTMVGLDRSTGEVRWSDDRAPASPTVEAVTTDTGATVVVVDEYSAPDAGPGSDAQLTAIDLVTGEQLWAAEGIEPFGSWSVVDGRLLAFRDRRLVAFDPSTGIEQWAYLPQGSTAGDPRLALRLVTVRSNGLVVLVLTADDMFLAGIGMDGVERWQIPISEPSRSAVPVVDVLPDAASDVVAIPLDGALAGVDLVTGEIRWTSDEVGDGSVEFTLRSDPSGVGVVCGVVDGSIVIGGFDLADGTLRWSEQIESAGRGVEGSALIGYLDGTVITTSSQASPASCEPSGAPFGDVTVRSMLDGSTIWSMSSGAAQLSATGLGPSLAASTDPEVVGMPGIVESGDGVWTRYEAGAGSVVDSGTLEPGGTAIPRGPFVATVVDATTVTGVSGAVPVGEVRSFPGWDHEQVYFWSVDGVLSAVR